MRRRAALFDPLPRAGRGGNKMTGLPDQCGFRRPLPVRDTGQGYILVLS